MELINNQKISNSTIDAYCFLTGIDPELNLPKSDKLKIVKERVEHLNKTEWQRWVPGVGFYRLTKDLINRDYILLLGMHSNNYDIANTVYNITTTSTGLGVALSQYLQ